MYIFFTGCVSYPVLIGNCVAIRATGHQYTAHSPLWRLKSQESPTEEALDQEGRFKREKAAVVDLCDLYCMVHTTDSDLPL